MSDSNTAAEFDRHHIWHPYSSLTEPLPTHQVAGASGTKLLMQDGREMIDGMASWWSAIHGYNHPLLNQAAQQQLEKMSHVMFGGLTHQPAIDLCRQLVAITPPALTRVFLSDSGSVAVEVAMKMALQYWQAKKQNKTRFVALKGGYHGDTLGAMSVCDPVTGMHHLFANVLPQQLFVERPTCTYQQACEDRHTAEIEQLLSTQRDSIAAVIAEPVVQGAGGMYFYSPGYLMRLRELCDQHQVLLILDEIATGFGRSGTLFGCDHAGISADIMCVGKAMTGGYLSLAATLATDDIAEGIGSSEAGAFMHGPTFMGNPLACAIANASIELLVNSDWRNNIRRIETRLQQQLKGFDHSDKVADVRILGAIGVIEAHNAVDMFKVQSLLPDLGVWLRPFGKLVYTMPPYICNDTELDSICQAMKTVVTECS